MIHPVELDRFRERTAEYDQRVARCDDIDQFCSSADWVLPAHDQLMPAREARLFEDGGEWIALAHYRDPRGLEVLEPMEACWGLTSPLVGATPAFLVEVLGRQSWHLMLLAGIVSGSASERRTLAELSRHFEVAQNGETTRYIASLEDGADGFLARRSRNFRRSLSRARARARLEGVDFEVADTLEPSEAIARIVDIDRRTWKGESGNGLEATGLLPFYTAMIPRLAASGRLRLQFARCRGADIAFIFGGVLGSMYRGCQFGYDKAFEHLGLGNLCQLEQMHALTAEGVHSYDLGTTSGHYKARWSDRVVQSSIYVVVNRPRVL